MGAKGHGRRERTGKPAGGKRPRPKRGDPKEPLPVTPGQRLPILPLLVLVLGFLVLALLAARQVGSLDVGFHLKAGEHILSGQGWPRTDPFTYTLNDHPYIDTSWGYQVLIAMARRALDAPGLVILHAALVLATFFILYRTARIAPVDPTSLVLFLVAGGVASEMRFEVRPELVSYLFLALVLHLLHRHAEGLRSPLWALPVIHLVWANSHSLFILGWGAIACFAAGLWIRDRRPDRRLFAWGLGSVAVAFLNPYGWRGVLFPFTLATRLQRENPFGGSIGEFVSPFALGISEQNPFYPRLPIFTFRILALLAVAALLVLLRRRRFHAGLIILAFLPLSAGMIRNIPLLVIAALPGMIWVLPAGKILGGIGLHGRARRLILAGTASGLGLALILLGLRVYHDAYYIASRRPERFGLGWNRLVLPVDAAEYAKKAALKGRFLNHLNFGGYLMWARSEPVFIDGRLEVVGEEFYRYYNRLLGSQEDLEAGVARYGIRWMMIPYAVTPSLLGRMSRDPRWRLAYFDHLAALFVRSDEPIGTAPPAMELPTPGSPVLGSTVPALPGLGGPSRRGGFSNWLAGLVRTENFPAEDFNRGLFHYFRGDLDLARGRFAEAIQSSGGAYYEIYNNLGAVLYRKKRFAEARDCYAIVLEADPANRIARERMAAMGSSNGIPAPARR